MEKKYKYGNEVEYSKLKIIKTEDRKKIQAFCCGNEVIDNYIHNEIFENLDAQGRHFMVTDKKTKTIIAFASLATSGIIHKETNYTHVLPAIKIDVFAVDTKYQKMHLHEESEKASDPNEHCYLSDSIMADVILHCRKIDEQFALANYIVLYAGKKAKRFYERNLFRNYQKFMVEERNAEVRELIPMYMEL